MWHELIQALDPYSTFFPGATTLQLIALERALSIRVPEELKNLLMESNGVRVQYGSRFILSVEEIIQENLDLRTKTPYIEDYMPFENLLFFADAGNGDMFAFWSRRIETGGLLVDHGWLRFLGSGDRRLSGNLLSWNAKGQIPQSPHLKGACIVAYDVVGGFLL